MWGKYGGERMKLKKNLISASVLAFSIFISTTSYAADKDKPVIKVNEQALSEMANKVTDETIIKEKVQDDENIGKTQGESEPSQTNPEENPNPPSLEEAGENPNSQNPDLAKDPNKEITKDDKPKNEEDLTKPQDPNIKDQTLPETADKASGGGPLASESISSQNSSLTENTSDGPKLESIDRLNNIKSQEESQGGSFYVKSKDHETSSGEKLTSKESMTTTFDDKGSKLSLNLEDRSDNKDMVNSRYLIRPQTLILLIAILGAILSALSIAIRGKKDKN